MAFHEARGLSAVFEAFLADEIDAARRIPTYSGSLDQFYAQQAFIDEVEPAVTLVRGARSLWEPAVIQLSLPRGRDAERSARLSAITLLHEVLHQRYTGVSGLGAAFRAVVAYGQAAGPDAHVVADAAFQWLEDARVTLRAAADYPDLAAYLGDFDEAVVREFEDAYREQFFEEPWTENPRSPEKQFLGALAFRIFTGQRDLPATKASVAAVIAAMNDSVVTALAGSVTEVANSAMAIGDVYRAALPL